MRRSRQISLVLVATVSATALGACDGTPPDTQVMGEFFKDTAECVAAYQTEEHGSKTQTESEAICKQADDEAKAEHAKTAPKFSTRADCEKEFGPEACVSAPQQQAATTPAAPGAPAPQQQAASSGGGIQESFMPFMLGYMLGGSGSSRQVTPTYYGPGSYREPDRDRRQVYTGGSAGGAATGAAPRPIGYVYRPPPSIPGSIRVPSASVVSPSRSTGGVPTPSSISNSMRSSTSLGSSSSFGRSSFGGGSSSSISSSSARGGFGSTGGGFSSGG